MGNLCSSAAKDDQEHEHQEVNHDNALKSPPPVSSTSSPPQPTKQNVAVPINRQSAKPLSPIEAAIAAARKELERNKGISFESVYTTSKLVGHGAFAKVSICEHHQTKAQYAAKVVTKNLEDPEKQREGDSNKLPC
jgi:hypothetical protein